MSQRGTETELQELLLQFGPRPDDQRHRRPGDGHVRGSVPQRCQQNALNNDAQPGAENPTGLAAIVKKDEEDAKNRRANVRFLGTVDCNYWPEAIDTLAKAPRRPQ